MVVWSQRSGIVLASGHWMSDTRVVGAKPVAVTVFLAHGWAMESTLQSATFVVGLNVAETPGVFAAPAAVPRSPRPPIARASTPRRVSNLLARRLPVRCM